MGRNIGRVVLHKFKLVMMYIASIAVTLGSISFAAPQFFGQMAYATSSTILVVTPDVLTGTNCTDAGASADTQCYNSIQIAIDAANPNDTILVSGTFGSIDTYTVYNVTKVITIRGVNTGDVKAKVYGTFLIYVDGATIDNLSITNKGISHPNKNAINLLGKQVTITNNDFNLGNGTGGVANGVVIWPYGDNPASLNITNNTFTGYSLAVPDWSSTALLIAEQISATPFTGTPMSTTITIADEKAFATGNTYVNNSYDYVHQNWNGGSKWFYSKVSNSAGLLDAIDNSAADATILVAAGTYKEQLTINKNLNLIGAGDATIIQSPDILTSTFNNSKSNPMKPVITIDGATVNISALQVDGAGKGDAITNTFFVGIGLHNAGGTIDHVTVTGVKETLANRDQQGEAIFAINADSSVRTLNITNSAISDFQKNGLSLSGTGLTVMVSGNNITGTGANNLVAQNGIHIGTGATGSVTNNTVSNLMCDDSTCGNDWYNDYQSMAIVLAGAIGPITVSGNEVSNSDVGIYSELTSGGSTITDNILTGNRYFGMLFEKGDVAVTGGSVTGGEIGIFNPAEHNSGVTTVHDVNIYGNSTAGLKNDAGQFSVDATNNWWGNASGPGVVGSGTGDMVSANVSFNPWYIDAGDTLSNSITLTVNSGGNGTAGTEGIYNYGDVFTLTNSPSINYHFVSWAGDADCADGSVTMITDTTCTANFAIDTHVVTFNSNGGSSISAITGIDYGTMVILPTPPAKTGYTFNGWYSDDLTFVVPFTGATVVTDDTTIYAKWTVNQYTITFNSNGGSDVDPIVQDYGTVVGTPPASTKAGYIFSAWAPEVPSTMGLDQTLTAQWVVDKSALISSITAEIGATHSSPEYILIQSNYTTASWNAYSNAITSAITVENNDDVIPAEVSDVAVLIGTTKAALAFKSNLVAYSAALAEVAEFNYTSGSWATYQTAMSANIVTTENTQAEVDTATSNISTAQSSLVTVIDDNLATVKAIEATLIHTDYVSYAAVTAALVLPETNNTEKITKTATLNGAMSGLVTVASIFNTISTDLTSANIANNLNTVTGSNWKNFSGLYFEKSVLVGQTMTKMGKITFTEALDLSNSDTQNLLQHLGEYLDMSSGHIALDARTATDLKNTGASIDIYNLPQGLNMNQISLIVKDENGVVLGDVTSDMSYTDLGMCEVGGICTRFSFNAGHFTSFDVNVVEDKQIAPMTNEDGSGSATVNSTNSEVVITNPDQAVTVDITSGTVDPTIDVSALMSLVDEKQTVTLPEITIKSDVADVTIPDGTIVTGSADWDGIIDAPTVGVLAGGNAPAGFSVGSTIISVGSPNGTLIFDKAVSIVLPGVTGAVGYKPSGSTQWVVINTICAGTYDNPNGAIYPGECAITNGTDTKILTFHFTSFGGLLAVVVPVVTTTPITPVAITASSESEAYYDNNSQNSTDSSLDSQATLGAQTKKDSVVKQLADTATAPIADSGWSIFGLMWYWWLAIIAAIVSAPRIISAVRNRSSQNTHS